MLFEQEIAEAQALIVYKMDEEACRDRWVARHGNEDAFDLRFKNFEAHSKDVADLYNRFSKCHFIDASREINEIYEDTRVAIFPHVTCLIGPPAANQDIVEQLICNKTEASHINFEAFVEEKSLSDSDMERCQALIAHLANVVDQRVVLTGFP